MTAKLSLLAEFRQPTSPTIELSQGSLKTLREEIAECLEKAKSCPWDADILKWWGLNEASFPRLHKLAKMTLGCPATSAASESAFTIASCVITARRSRLSPFKAGQMLFIHDNFSTVEKFLSI